MGKRRLPVLSGPVTIYLLCNLLAMAIGAILVQWGSAGKSPNQYLVGSGLSVLAAGVTGIVMVGYIIFSESTRNRITVLRDFGIREYFDSNTTAIKGEYQRRLDTPKKNIDVLGLGLTHLRRDFGPQFEDWASRGVVRILLLDPEAPQSAGHGSQIATTYASQRDREERDPVGSIAKEVNEWLVETRSLRARTERFKLRLSRAIPTITMVRMDDEIFWSPYLMYRGSGSTPTMVVRRGGLLYEVLRKHFDDIWNSTQLSVDASDVIAEELEA
jgi:hypothetical protein